MMQHTSHATPMMQPLAQRKDFVIHMIGICGAGMSGIAELLNYLGYQISGSDLTTDTHTGRYLQSIGITVFHTHDAHNLGDAQLVVYSSAIKEDNEELLAAHARNIPCMGRAEMLADLIRYYYGIAVAGTHGKTTTTSLIQHIFDYAGMQPTYIAGARLLSQQSHASIGSSKYFIIEADESDASFSHIHPVMTIITNIGEDHMHTYQHDTNVLHKQYLAFVHNTPFYGTVIVCGDDAGVASITPHIHRKVIYYGLKDENDYYASDITIGADGTKFRLHTQDGSFDMTLALFGLHNVQNAVAAVTVGLLHEMPISTIQQALASFPGVSRRFNRYQITINNKSVTLIDDYGHHPTEIAATLQTARALYATRRIVLVFQPHRYTRTHDLFDEFMTVLETADLLLITNTYAAGEAAIANADSRSLCRSIRNRGRLDPIFVADMSNVMSRLTGIACDDDVLLIQGAGDITQITHRLVGHQHEH